jgi:hypothetical protein
MQIFDLMEHLRRLKSFTMGLFCEALEVARPSPIDSLTATGAPNSFILAKGGWAQVEAAGLPRRTSSGRPWGLPDRGSSPQEATGCAAGRADDDGRHVASG